MRIRASSLGSTSAKRLKKGMITVTRLASVPPISTSSFCTESHEPRERLKDVAQKSTGAVRANCSNATLHDGYGLHATETKIGVGDFAAVGRFTFDGKGNLTGKLFTNAAGNYSESPEFRGTYSVSPATSASGHKSLIVDAAQGGIWRQTCAIIRCG